MTNLRKTPATAKPAIWQNANGTWSHHKDSKCEWADRVSCETDLRFHEEWAR